MNENQIKIVNKIIARWRRYLRSAKSDDEKKQIELEIKTLEDALENDRHERNKDRRSS
jgi:hypothetical protein